MAGKREIPYNGAELVTLLNNAKIVGDTAIKVEQDVKKSETAAITATDAATRALGAVGKTSYIGVNGNWMEWNTVQNKYVDSGVQAQGIKGDTGNGILSVVKTNTVGLTDTYTITFTDSTTTTFNIENAKVLLPTATKDILGGIKVGSGLSIDDGTLSLGADIPSIDILKIGNKMAGYYGKANGMITGADLCTSVGLTAGILANSGDITWLKFSHNYKTLFVADRAIRNTISWDNIQAQNLVKGKVITIGEKQYLCRLMTGGNSNPASSAGGEWDDLIAQFTPNDEDSHWDFNTGDGARTWCKEISNTLITRRIVRGSIGISNFDYNESGYILKGMGYRPVLELL